VNEVRKMMPEQSVVPYDENLLERARTQWEFGDWQSLAKLDREALQHHPERARLALLAAAGRLQADKVAEARQFVRLAQDWGVSKRLIARVLISGVYNSLGRMAALSGQQQRALQHFKTSVALGGSGGDENLLARARAGEQLAQLGLPAGTYRIDEGSAQYQKGVAQLTSAHNNRIKDEIRAEINSQLKATNPNPYSHNRTLTPDLNQALREFAEKALGLKGLKSTYIDYLGTKAIQVERNCVGRLATTVQDAIARQLVAECVPGDRICILEIGALYGVSLAILYNHAVTRFVETKVVCLDPFDGYYGTAIDAVLNQPVDDLTFKRNMQLANVPEPDYQIIKHYSAALEAQAAARELKFNVLIIDGDHSYEGVAFDFNTYFPMLEPGGYVIFDDYNAKEWPDVTRFVDGDLRNVSNFEYLGSVSRTAVGRKKKE